VGCCRERDGKHMKVVEEEAPREGGSRLRVGWGLRMGCGMENGHVDEIWAVSGHWLNNSVC